MPDVTGARHTGNENQAQRRIDIAPQIRLLESQSTILTLLSNTLGSEVTTDPKYTWFEDKSLNRFDAINNGAGYNTSATSIVVDNGAYFQSNDLAKNTRTGEVFRVTGISTNTLTVERGIGNSGTGVAMLDNDEILIIGSSFNEFALSREAVSNNPVQKVNYTEITRDTVKASRTLLQSSQYTTPNDWVYQNKKNAIEHAKSKELKFLFGKASENLSYTGGPLRTTGGLVPSIVTNVTDAGGTLSESEWNAALRGASRYAPSSTWMGLCSAIALSALNGYPMGKLQVVDQARREYGLDVSTFTSPFGSVKVAYHRLLEGAVYGGYLIGAQTEGLKYRYLSNENGSSDTHVNTNIQEPNRDGRADEILSECGLQFPEESKSFLITGITG